MLTKLDVVNAQLATMGVAPILEAELGTHPYAQIGLLRLRIQSRLFQTRGWWFNTLQLDMTPGPAPDYVIEFPCGILRIEGPGSLGISIRGNALYDHRAGALRGTPVTKAKAVVELAFEDLPPVPQTYAMLKAVQSFQQDYDSTTSRREELAREVREARMELETQDLREMRANRLLMPQTLDAIAAIRQGSGYQLPVR